MEIVPNFPLDPKNTLGIQKRDIHDNSLIGSDDRAAITSWYIEFDGVKTTQRAYRREAERFYRWCEQVCHKALAQLDRADIEAYRRFMSAPPDTWCGRRGGSREKNDWRPFEGPLSEAGQRQALIILGGMFSYMVQGGYLRANPIALVKRKGAKRAKDPGKTIREPVMQRFLTFLKASAETATPGEKSAKLREYFVCSWLYWTGARREELANARLADLRVQKNEQGDIGKMIWRVAGKGGVEAYLPLKLEAWEALRTYLSFENLGLGENQDGPLLRSLRGVTSNLSPDQVYDIVVSSRQRYIQSSAGKDDVHNFEKVTPHWFRHAITAHLLDAGTDPRHVQRYLRHESIETTMIYDSTEDDVFYNAITSERKAT
jgi:integrase/recombinase XerC